MSSEIEEELAIRAWAERVGVEPTPYLFDIPFKPAADGRSYTYERGAVLPPAQMLREHELKTYRDHPAKDAYDALPFLPLGWLVMGSSLLGGLGYFAVAGGRWLLHLH